MKLAEFKVDNQTVQLGYSYNAIVDAEDVAQCNLLDAFERLGRDMTAHQLRGLLYAMIVPFPGFPKDAKGGLEAAGNMIRMDTLPSIRYALAEAAALAVSEEFAKQFEGSQNELSADVPAPTAESQPQEN